MLNDATAQYKTEVTAATCTAGGYTESWWEVNGQQFNYQKYDETDALGHAWGEWTTVDAPTCTDDGVQQHTCRRCGITESDPLETVGHDYQTTIEPATCTAQGYTHHECSRCHAAFDDNYTDVIPHTWGEWVTTQAPTATTPGAAERTCAICSMTEQKTLPATAPVTGTTNKGGDNSGTVWLIFGIIAGGVLVLGGGAVSWLFIAGRQRKKQVAAA